MLVLYMRRESASFDGSLLRGDVLRRGRRRQSADLWGCPVAHGTVRWGWRGHGGPWRQRQLWTDCVAQVGVTVRCGVPGVQPHASVGRQCPRHWCRRGRWVVVPCVVYVRNIPIVVLAILKKSHILEPWPWWVRIHRVVNLWFNSY